MSLLRLPRDYRSCLCTYQGLYKATTESVDGCRRCDVCAIFLVAGTGSRASHAATRGSRQWL